MRKAKLAAAIHPTWRLVFNDGTAKEDLGKVVYGREVLRGQPLADDWSNDGRFLGINRGRGFQNFGIKSVAFLCELKRVDRGF